MRRHLQTFFGGFRYGDCLRNCLIFNDLVGSFLYDSSLGCASGNRSYPRVYAKRAPASPS